MITVTFYTIAEAQAFIKNENVKSHEISDNSGKEITISEYLRDNLDRYDTANVEG